MHQGICASNHMHAKVKFICLTSITVKILKAYMLYANAIKHKCDAEVMLDLL